MRTGDQANCGQAAMLERILWASNPALQIQPIVVGTAGHIDHGKSTLVQALTGVDPDRWKEEKERGMTIDLGFARFDLPDGRRMGIVDVPGHERLVRNMVAGATGIDLVMLVVAADDGVMPQTLEHLSILELLGLKRGLVVLTKVDLVDEDLRELVELDIRETVQGTFLEDAPILSYSAVTRQGFEELKETLVELAGMVPAHSPDGIFRMPIQRVFSARGFGTIVTGIPVVGSVGVGDTLEVLPIGLKGKVRGLQAYHESVDRAQAGHSTAINLSDVDHHAVSRGMVVARPGFFGALKLVGARLKAVKHLPIPIRNRMPIRLHSGTAEVLGEVILLDHEVMNEGDEGFVQLRLEEPLVCAPGDRFVLRLASPMYTLGGGVILEESRYRLKRFKGFVIDSLNRREQSLSSEVDLLESILMSSPEGWMLEAELAKALKVLPERVADLLGELQGADRAVPMGAGHWMCTESLTNYRVEIRRSVAVWFDENAHRGRMDVRDLRSRVSVSPTLLDVLLKSMEEEGQIQKQPGGFLLLKDHSPRLDGALQGLADSVKELYVEAKFQPPTQEDLPKAILKDATALQVVLEFLCDTRVLERVSGSLFADHQVMERLRKQVIANCEKNGELQLAELRDGLGTTRKYLIPMLEALDAEGLTQRKGGGRFLKARS